MILSHEVDFISTCEHLDKLDYIGATLAQFMRFSLSDTEILLGLAVLLLFNGLDSYYYACNLVLRYHNLLSA